MDIYRTCTLTFQQIDTIQLEMWCILLELYVVGKHKADENLHDFQMKNITRAACTLLSSVYSETSK